MRACRSWMQTAGAICASPFRLLYRVAVLLLTVLVVVFGAVAGGVPRIQPPEKKNRITHTHRK